MKKFYLLLFSFLTLAYFTANSQCSTIQPLTLGTSTSVTLSGTGSWSQTNCGAATPGNEQVYIFTAPSSGTYKLNVVSATGGPIAYFYKAVSAGCSSSSWTCINSFNGPGSTNFGPLTAGTQYYILADAEGTSSRTHSFNVTVPAIRVTENITPFLACDNAFGSLPQSFTIEGFDLNGQLDIIAPSGFTASLNPTGGGGGPVQLLPTAAGNIPPTTIYVKFFGNAPGNYSGNITFSSFGGNFQNIPVSGTLIASPPTVNLVTSQTVCNNGTTTPINFTSTTAGTNYMWTNSNPAIGLPASGYGNIPSFTTTNTTNAPISGLFSVTPIIGTPAPDLLYYKFDGVGNTVPNMASNPPASAINATINGAMTQGGSGVCGGFLQSNGVSTNDYLNTNWAPNYNASFTISFIASGFPTNVNNVSYDVFGNFNVTKYLLGTYESNTFSSGNFFALYGQNGGGFNVVKVQGNFTTAKTITYVYDHSIQQIKSYLDGVLQETVNGNFSFIGSAFYIGNIFNGNVGSPPSGSKLDEFRMYGRALSSSEVTALVGSCNASGACTGAPTFFSIGVYPDLVVNDPADQTICAGSATTAVNFTGTAGAVYNWTNNNPSIGLAASGTGNIPSFTPTFSGTSPVTATITITPSFSGGPACTSSSQTFTMTVNPIPTVNNVPNQTVCNNAATTAINFSGTVPGTNYTWTNSNPSIGLPANGSGNIPSFTAINATGSPVTSTITVTPSYGAIAVPEILYYKFDGVGTTVPNLASNPPPFAANANITSSNLTQGGSGICDGTLIGSGFSGSVSTSWQPSISSSWTISIKSSNISTTTNNGAFTNFGNIRLDGNGNDWTLRSTLFADLVATGGSGMNTHTNTFVYDASTLTIRAYVDGVLVNTVSVAAPIVINAGAIMLIGAGPNGRVLPAGGLLDEFRLYNRALSAGEVTNIANNCNPVATCTGSPEIFSITVNPSPTVNAVTNQNVCTGNNTTAINFTGNVAGATYNWTNSNLSIGLAASGSGNIPSFSAINPGTTTQTATITVTPVSPSSSCPVTPESFTISVSPVPTGTATPITQTICSQSAINTISFTGNVPGITFDWTRDNLATVTGIPGVGNGNINGTLTNTTNALVTVTFTVTPSIGGCVGTPFTVTVDVGAALPTAIASSTTQTTCSGANIIPIALSSTSSGLTTFAWTRNNVTTVTGIPSSGSGDISGALVNTTALPITVTFNIIPTANGCVGLSSTVTVVVNPVPDAIATPATQLVCSNSAITPIILSSSVAGTAYNWTRDNTVDLSGIPSNGTSNISGTLINNTNAPSLTTFTITPVSASGCLVNATTATVLVNPRATVNIVGDRVLCNGATSAAINFTSPTTGGTIVYNWTNNTTSIGLAVSGSGNIAAFTATNTTNAPLVATIIVTPTFTNGISCTGAPQTFTITVNPTPTVNTVANIAFCNAVASTPINFSGFVPGTVYSWTNNNTSISVGANGTGNIASFVPTNAGTTPITSTITVTPSYPNAGVTCTGASTSFVITVNPTTRLATQPVDRAICFGSSTAYTVTATGVGLTYQWQVNPGSGFTNITGATTATLNIPVPPSNLNFSGNRYRCIVTGTCGADTSIGALLTVNSLPSITLNASPRVRLLPNQTTGITATVNPTGGTFNWFYNDTLIIGVTTGSLTPIAIDKLGSYKAIYTDLNGCVSTAFPISIVGEPSNNLWVFPNPNSGQFNIRFYNENKEQAIVSIYNSVGKRIFRRTITTANTYNTTNIDIRNQTAGYYIIEVTNKNNVRLATKRVLIQP